MLNIYNIYILQSHFSTYPLFMHDSGFYCSQIVSWMLISSSQLDCKFLGTQTSDLHFLAAATARKCSAQLSSTLPAFCIFHLVLSSFDEFLASIAFSSFIHLTEIFIECLICATLWIVCEIYTWMTIILFVACCWTNINQKTH